MGRSGPILRIPFEQICLLKDGLSLSADWSHVDELKVRAPVGEQELISLPLKIPG